MYDSRKDIKWTNLRVGLVVSAALAVLFFTVMFAGSLERIFIKRVDVFAEFEDVKGLREGAPVWFAGLEIGSVTSISLAPQRRVVVKMSINPAYMRFLKKDSEATILTLGLLGDKYIEISPGSPEAEPLGPSETIKGVAQVEFKDIVETSQTSLLRLTDFIKTLEKFIRDIEKGQGTLARFLKDPGLYNDLQTTAEQLKGITEAIQQGEGTLGRLLKDDRLYDQALQTTVQLRSFSERLNSSQGTLRLLIEDPGLYNRLNNTALNLEEFSVRLNTSEGTIKSLIEDRELYDSLTKSLQHLSQVLEDINSGKGVLGAALKDEKLKQQLQKTIQDLDELIKDIKENPGRYFKFSLF